MLTISPERDRLATDHNIREGSTAQRGRALDLRSIVGALLLLFLLSAGFSAFRKDITVGFDELAHASYVADLQAAPGAVELERLRMLDPATFRFTDQPNYLNHPPYYYQVIASAGPRLEGHPEALIWYRSINVAMVGAGLLLLIGLSLSLVRSNAERLILIVPLFCAPILAPLAGSVNNDNLGFTAGALTLFGCGRFLMRHRHRDFAIALLGVILAGAAKLTALMLCGSFLALCLLFDWRNVRPAHIAWAMLASVLAAFPAFELWLAYGSPAPDTAAQHALLVKGSAASGWTAASRLTPLSYGGHFIAEFIAGWKPLLTARSPIQIAMLALPVVTLLLAAAGTALALRRMTQQPQPDAATKLTVAGAAAIAVTLIVHMVFSYRRHIETGWLMDAYPRYYLPLAFIVPLATLQLVQRMAGARGSSLKAFLILSPVVFGVLG